MTRKKKIKLTESDNMHGDHVATCLCCANAYYSEGSPGYSEYTPGSPASMSCRRGRWEFDDCITSDLIQFMHDTGRRCSDFEPRPTAPAS